MAPDPDSSLVPSQLGPDFFRGDAVECARRLIGTECLWLNCGGLIVETEAYRAEGDPACHTFFRAKARRFVEENSAGTAYVYLNYGVHWLLNFLTKGEAGIGFVLIRALQPTRAISVMRQRRGDKPDRELCSGPGKLTQALSIGQDQHGIVLPTHPDCQLRPPARPWPTRQDGRIGISRAQDYPWRFTATSATSWISRPYRAPEN